MEAGWTNQGVYVEHNRYFFFDSGFVSGSSTCLNHVFRGRGRTPWTCHKDSSYLFVAIQLSLLLKITSNSDTVLRR